MGCASSTPMVATAGSEMLKAATHVREKGEAVVEDATQTLTTGLDTAKETVGAAVAGITNDLGNAFKEGTHVLDEAKHKVMEGLHLEQPAQAEEATTAAAAAESGEVMAELSSSRAPTPQLQEDADSLKTSTPEPEIERALANDEESPPTPQPSLEELAHLSAEVASVSDAQPPAAPPAVAEAMAAPAAIEAPAAPAPAASVEGQWFRRSVAKEEPWPPRPNTTEWEKFADQLAKNKKFKPYESFVHSQNHFSVYKDHTSLRDKPGHTDGHFSGGNSLSSTSQSDLSSGHVTPAMSRKGQREFAKFVASEGPASVSRASSRISNAGSSRTFDFNPTRDRISVFEAMSGSRSRVGSAIKRAPAERMSLWGKHAAVAEEEPPTTGHGRRMSTGMSTQSVLRASTEYKNPYGIRRAVRPVSQTRSIRVEKQTSSVTPRKVQGARRIPSSEPLHRAEDPPRRPVHAKERRHPSQEGNTAQMPLPMEEPHEQPQKNLRVLQISTPLEETPTDLSPSPTEDGSSIRGLPLNQGKPSLPQTHHRKDSPTEAASPPKMQPTSTWKSPFTPKMRTTSSRKIHSPTSPRMLSPSATRTHSPATTRTQSPSDPRMESPTISRRHSPSTPKMQSPSSPRKHSPPTAKMQTPSPPPTRASTAKSSDSSLDVVVRPMSKLNTPSTKSLTPDQVVMAEYEDAALEAALASLELLRGSTATLHSLRSCSPGRHTYTASLLNSRRTSPWVMRKDYGCSKGKENKPSTAVAASAPKSTPTHERCDICSNEFVLN
ncbi:proteoglycan 4 [Drosophila obscura]|uniref:proteoglycan 4 n=1 Tax=Drosophila obscura TaxID=7282 RepID=UPI001BB23821|nr:proteoglycan 4 [Drosophila obscura]